MSPAEIAVAACLFAIIGVLCAIRWRLRISCRQKESDERLQRETSAAAPADGYHDSSFSVCHETGGSEVQPSAVSTSTSRTDGELDLQLLRFLSDEIPGELSRQIDRYLAAFESDRCRARSIFATNDPQQIHRLAHRLIAHAGAVHCVPLHSLATTLQSESARLRPDELDQLMAEFDCEFEILRKKLDALRRSTEHA